MSIQISISKVKSNSQTNQCNIEAPCHFSDDSSPNIDLYYSRLPAGMTPLDVQNSLLEERFEFVSDAELNFILVLVDRRKAQDRVIVVRDRYSSQNVWITNTGTQLIISTNLKNVAGHAKALNETYIDQFLSNRILSNQAVFSGITQLPHTKVLRYDGELEFLDSDSEHLTIYNAPVKLDDQVFIEKIWSSINESYANIGLENEVAVLLSGGVDSFILAATAVKKFKRVVAYTPDWSEGKNPELPRAIRFAKHLGIEHKVVTISSKAFGQAYEDVLSCNPISLRNYSSLILHSLFPAISEEYILYGEYADTLFGSNTIKNAVLDRKYYEILSVLPQFCRPSRLSEFLSKLTGNDVNRLINIPQITVPFIQNALKHLNLVNHPSSLQLNVAEKPTVCERVSGISFNIGTDCAQHMLEIETSAIRYGKKIVTPFYNSRMVAISNTISDEQMFGKSALSLIKNFRKDNSLEMKPLLKKLACEFIEPDAIYLKKLGFPTPFGHWVDDYIATDSWQAYSVDLSFCKNAEQKWSFINALQLANAIK